jgi:UDP-N-acetylmuramate--alanine ligase
MHYFQNLDIPQMKRAEVLGMISRSYRTIAIAGTHGKTSTSAMATYILRSGGIDVTGFLGGIVKDYESNFVYGTSEWVVVEADEFDRSFMHLAPEISVLLSMDPDHLDIYGNHDEMKKTFREFSLLTNSGGSLLVSKEVLPFVDSEWRKKLLNKDIKLYSFGVEEGWFRATQVEAKDHRFNFDFIEGEETKMKVGLSMPGVHNVSNATAALGIASLLGADGKKIEKDIPYFQGVQRRFERIVSNTQCVYIDDYAHHPVEIRAAITAMKTLYPDRILCVIFQPHLFTRTRDFMEDFARELGEVDELILMDIYPAREMPIKGITSSRIMELIPHDRVSIKTENEILDFIKEEKNNIELLMTLGAGNIDKLVLPIYELLK